MNWPGLALPSLALPGSALALYHGLIHSQFIHYKIEILSRFAWPFYICRINLWTKNLVWFWNRSVSGQAGFSPFLSWNFAYNSWISQYFQNRNSNWEKHHYRPPIQKIYIVWEWFFRSNRTLFTWLFFNQGWGA